MCPPSEACGSSRVREKFYALSWARISDNNHCDSMYCAMCCALVGWACRPPMAAAARSLPQSGPWSACICCLIHIMHAMNMRLHLTLSINHRCHCAYVMAVALLALTHVMLLIHSFIGFYNFKFKLASCMKQHTVIEQLWVRQKLAGKLILSLLERLHWIWFGGCTKKLSNALKNCAASVRSFSQWKHFLVLDNQEEITKAQWQGCMMAGRWINNGAQAIRSKILQGLFTF
jgi:hypothetical protein